MGQFLDQSHFGIERGYEAGTPVRARPLQEGIGTALRDAFAVGGQRDAGGLLPVDMRVLLSRI